MAHTTDLDLTEKDIRGLASVDALMSFLGRLGYETDPCAALSSNLKSNSRSWSRTPMA